MNVLLDKLLIQYSHHINFRFSRRRYTYISMISLSYSVSGRIFSRMRSLSPLRRNTFQTSKVEEPLVQNRFSKILFLFSILITYSSAYNVNSASRIDVTSPHPPSSHNVLNKEAFLVKLCTHIIW